MDFCCMLYLPEENQTIFLPEGELSWTYCMSNMACYNKYVCRNYDPGSYDHSQDRFRPIPYYIVDKLVYYSLRFERIIQWNINALLDRVFRHFLKYRGAWSSVSFFSTTYIKPPISCYALNTCNWWDRLVVFLFIIQPSPISCFTNYFKFIGTSTKLTISDCPSWSH
jgi:hypothetical protein